MKLIVLVVLGLAFCGLDMTLGSSSLPPERPCVKGWLKQSRYRHHVSVHPKMNIQNALFQVKPWTVVHFRAGNYRRSATFRIPGQHVFAEGDCNRAILHSPIRFEGERNITVANFTFDGLTFDGVPLTQFGGHGRIR